MAARIFFQAFFFAQIFLGEFTHPPPGISNDPPLSLVYLVNYYIILEICFLLNLIILILLNLL
jgi:hypothetical protein